MNFSKSRLITAVLIVAGISAVKFFQTDKGPSFRFVFMTDMHVTTDKNGDQGYTAAVNYINNMKPKPDFVITGGDLIFDALGQSQQTAEDLYDLYQRITDKLEMPVYNCIGNHDHLGIYKNSGIDPEHPLYSTELFKKRMSLTAPYSSFDHENWHFVLLNSISITPERRYTGNFDEAQLAWLRNDLEKTEKGTNIVLTSHIPLYSAAVFFRNNSLAANTPGLVTDNSHEVMEICEPYRLKAVLQGHLHIVEDIGWKDTRFITGGAVSGAWWNGPYHGFPEGFVVVDVKGDEFQWHYETYGWDAAGS